MNKEEIKHLSQSYYDIHEKYDKLQQENKILKENAENNDKVVDKVNWENQLLKKENKQLKMINKEYERLNKEKNRGFKITNVQEYNIDKLLSYKKYKDNWNKLKKQEIDRFNESQDVQFLDVLQDMQKLEQGSDSNE